jgi:23S rRNA (cytosine1962-C5)-methyltransferase
VLKDLFFDVFFIYPFNTSIVPLKQNCQFFYNYILVYNSFINLEVFLMELVSFSNFSDYQLLDSGYGYRLERFGKFVIQKPDPQAIWQPKRPELWTKVDAKFTGKKERPWEVPNPSFSGNWTIEFQKVKLTCKLTPFKHTGVFPEQAAHWEWLYRNFKKPLKILNLFGYTGAVTTILAKSGHHVTHVDASKPSLTWANLNAKINGIPVNRTRWILDDALKFAQREVKRGGDYNGIILDPPAFGHTPDGKTWKFEVHTPMILKACGDLLKKQGKFLLINAYATNTSSIAIQNLLGDIFPVDEVTFGELCLDESSGRKLSTGVFGRWQKRK